MPANGFQVSRAAPLDYINQLTHTDYPAPLYSRNIQCDMMKARNKNQGTILLVTVFAIALLAALVVGILQMNTEEIMLMNNHIGLSEALAVAQAGLNDAFAELRTNSGWTTGYSGKSFEGGSYDVSVSGSLPNITVESTGTSRQGFQARAQADLTLSGDSPYIIRVDTLRINE